MAKIAELEAALAALTAARDELDKAKKDLVRDICERLDDGFALKAAGALADGIS
jgi:hypothetical protein